jgi:hypothetical protein
MTIQPYTSPQAPPLDTSTSGGGNGSIPTNAAVPDLAMVWGTAPPFTPSPSGGSASSNGSSAPVAGDLSIDLGSLRDGEDQMLGASSTVVDAYENLKQLFESGKNTVFGQQAKDSTQTHQGSGGGYVNNGTQTWQTTTTNDPIQGAAQAFADGQNGQPGMNDVQAYALQQVANAMALVGEFIALMNAAGDNYSQTDASSALPPAQ